MSDTEAKAAVGEQREMCDHICLLPAFHVDEGRPHFYGYDSRTWNASRAEADLAEAVDLLRCYQACSGPTDDQFERGECEKFEEDTKAFLAGIESEKGT